VKNLEHLHNVTENAEWCNHYGKQYRDYTHTHTHTHTERERERHLEIELLNDPAILYLGIYLNKIKSGYRSDITNHFT
jgi:hypothetical protein